MSEAKGNVHLRGAETSISVLEGSTLGMQEFSAVLTIDNVGTTLFADVDFASEDNGVISFILNSPKRRAFFCRMNSGARHNRWEPEQSFPFLVTYLAI